MSDSESDDGFIAWGAKKKGGAQFARADHAQATASSQPSAPALRPPERKIAAAERSHLRAVKTLTKQNQLTRNLALQGIEAADDADTYASVRATGGQNTVSQPKPTLNAAMPSQTIYDRAYTYSEHDTTTDLDSAKAFEQAAGALKVRVLTGAVGTAQRREDTLVFLAAFNKSADFYHEAGQTRRAITMFERLIDFCTEQSSASAAAQDTEVAESLTKAHRYALKKLITLHACIGGIDARRRATVELKELEDSLVASGKAVVPLERETVPPRPAGVPSPAPAPVPAVQDKPKALEPAQSVQGAAESKKKGKKGEAQETAAVPALAPAASTPDKSEGLSFADAKVEAEPAPAQPTELPPIPDLPAEDGTPATSFKRAVIQAMFYHNFEGVTSLLNNATLFNDSVAREAVGLRLEGLGISLPMVCAGGDQNRLLKQYLGTLTAAQRVQEIVHVRDAQGNNSIMHACALNRARALDELLRQLHDSGVAYTPAPSEGDAASLVDIGLPLQSAKGYSMAIQNQLRTFLREPAKYVASKAALSSGPAVTSAPATMNAAALAGPTLYGVPLGPAGAVVPAALLAAQAQFAMIATMFQQAAAMNAMAGVRAGAVGPGPALPQSGQKQAQRGQAQGRGGKAGGKGSTSSDAPPKGSWASAAGKGHTAPAEAPSPSGAPPAASAPAAAHGATFATDAEIAARRAAAAPTAVIGKGKAGAAAAGNKADAGTDAAAAEANAKFGGLSLDEDLVKATGSSARGARGQGGRGGRTGRRKALFDQFKANEELFGIKATYDETLYTSVLDRSAFTPEEVAAADALARQIDDAESRKATRGPLVDDEEGQFSAVAQGGRHKSGAGGKR